MSRIELAYDRGHELRIIAAGLSEAEARGFAKGLEAALDVVSRLSVEAHGVTEGEVRGWGDALDAADDRLRAVAPHAVTLRLREGPNLWIGYCDICNGQHCVQLLDAKGDHEIRRPHRCPTCGTAPQAPPEVAAAEPKP